MLDKKHLKEVKLLLVGSNVHKFEKWLNYLEKHNVEISTFGYVAKECMSSAYSNADVLICPSYYEEFGYVVLEAMACGLPVIVSNIPSFRDMVVDGYNGFIIEPNNYVKLSSLLSTLIENKKMSHEMGEKSLKVVEEKYSPTLVVQKIRNIVKEL
jgi:glycosyltransferase involved in cell wall biosynthesis